MLDTKARHIVQPAVSQSATMLLKAGLTANQVTVIAFIIGISAGLFIYLGQPVLALAALWFSGFLDVVDGTMARKTKPSPLGTVMDITFDRLVEISVILGLAFSYPDLMWVFLLISAGIIFSMTVFLTVGATAEKSGIKTFYYQPGLAERTEGFILFSIMIIFPDFIMWTGLLFLGVVTFTAVQRLREAVVIFAGSK